ncbi:MAG: DUF1636 domain-containing protein [Paracoccaceae bacterium]|jgi:predicted metal-binding protein|nr:DUF1636 domain-containing protein [Paracoccaceae bacterium]
MTEPRETELLVCTTCRMGMPTDIEGPRPGAQLYQALSAAALPEGVVLKPVECLSNCNEGCSVVLRSPGKWTYVYGRFDPANGAADTIVDGTAKYHSTEDGLVPWRERPEHFRKNCIARIPPLEIPNV